jgi:hypothetical protein
MTCVAATRVGAAFPGAHWDALRHAPAPSQLMTTKAVNRTRKQNNLHMTRISAGGYGAMGPHPEREPA